MEESQILSDCDPLGCIASLRRISLVLHGFAQIRFTSISAIHRTGDEQVFQPMVIVSETVKILKR